MIEESCTFYSTVTPSLLRKTLLKSFAISLLGLLILLGGGIFVHPTLLKTWGGIIFIVGLGLITFGWLPYRRLTYLAAKPNQIRITSEPSFQFISRGHMIFNLPINTIKKLIYVKDQKNYGIGIQLMPDFKKQLKGKNLYLSPSPQNPSLDLFLPYFSQRSFDELREYLSFQD